MGSNLNYYTHLLKRFKLIHLYKELKRARGINFNNLNLIARSGFPSIDKVLQKEKISGLPSLINPEFAKRTDVYQRLKESGLDPTGTYPMGDSVEQRTRHFEDVFYWNASNTLATKLSLRYSVWKRDPTNDLRVVRFCLSLPEDQYVQGRLDRALIRRATKNLLPDKIRLNTSVFGVQGADWVHRMTPIWGEYLDELRCLISDKDALEYLNVEVLKDALLKAEDGPRPECAIDPDFKILMRSLIVYRFIKKFT